MAGGESVTAALSVVVAAPQAASVQWDRVHFWWADERFLPTGDVERNETTARHALLDNIDIPQAQVHAIAGPGNGVASAGAAAELYARELVLWNPIFDVTILGVGHDGHVASLFPQHDALQRTEPAVGITDSPKPPASRVSVTPSYLRRSRDVWFLATGSRKSAAVAAGVDPTSDPFAHPSRLVTGMRRTVWYLDAESASQIPEHIPGDGT